MMKKRIILGIDPGISNVGVSLVSREDGKVTVHAATTLTGIPYGAQNNFFVRANILMEQMERFIRMIWPIVRNYVEFIMAAEMVPNKGRDETEIHTKMEVNIMLGMLIKRYADLAVDLMKIPRVELISPMTSKKLFTGNGNVDKLAIESTMLGLIEIGQIILKQDILHTDHTYDAIMHAAAFLEEE